MIRLDDQYKGVKLRPKEVARVTDRDLSVSAKFKAARFWFRSSCHNAVVTDVPGDRYKCSQCGFICKLDGINQVDEVPDE